MLILRRHGAVLVREQFFSFSGGFLRCQFLYSTASSSSSSSSSSQKPHWIVDYLVDSLGFSRQAAITASSKIKVTPHLKSPKNADLVVNLFKDYGLDNTQIKDFVSFYPNVLLHSGNNSIQPKLKFFQQLGLSGADLVKVMRNDPLLLHTGLNTHIVPAINSLRQILGGSDENVIEVIRRSRWVLRSKPRLARITPNVLLLQRYNVSNDKIKQALLKYPEIFHLSTDLLKKRIHWVEDELGIPGDSPMFIFGLSLSICYTKSLVGEKMQVFKSFGWSNSELSTLLKAQPLCLTCSTATIRDKLDFLMKKIGYTPSFLISNPSCITYSLERRVKPRFKILKMLKEKKLVNDKPCLNSILHYSDLKFLQFLRRFESDIPGLCEGYMHGTRITSKTG